MPWSDAGAGQLWEMGNQSLQQIALSVAQATKIRGKGTVLAGTDSLLAVAAPNLHSATKTAPIVSLCSRNGRQAISEIYASTTEDNESETTTFFVG